MTGWGDLDLIPRPHDRARDLLPQLDDGDGDLLPRPEVGDLDLLPRLNRGVVDILSSTCMTFFSISVTIGASQCYF